MTRKHFGTDGIRGRTGEMPMTPDFVMKLGWAAGKVMARHQPGGSSKRATAVIGKDTRLSGYMFESALEAGFAAAGVDSLLLGPMPTPAIAYLTRTFHATLGVVISASHNPFHDNGVKFFSSTGSKLPDDIELEIEALLDTDMLAVEPEQLGRARRLPSAPGRYVEFCKGSFRSEKLFDGLKLVIDCAHGATYHVAPNVFIEMGADVVVIGDKPDGLNINDACGSTDTTKLRKAVLKHEADLGIAFDGDGDRCILVDRDGSQLDGDDILYIIATSRHREGTLRQPVVGTLMTNLGLELALRDLGIAFERAKVGDRYVMERLQAADATIGGESSGHILCLDRTTTGDGIVSALQVLEVMVDSGKPLKELLAPVQKTPQVLVNVRINGDAATLMADPAVRGAVESAELELGEKGRVLLRPSGTEPLIRVMVESADESQVKRIAEQIADSVREAAAH